jgi:hypothetical protein
MATAFPTSGNLLVMHRGRTTICFVVVVLAATPAAAQPGDAETLFNQGKVLMNAGKFAEACKAFASSQKLAPAITTMVNLANCREKTNEIASSWELFNEVERQTRDKTDAGSVQLHKLASDRAATLGPRVSRLTINVASPTKGIEILRDDVPVAPATWNTGLPIDGGTYKITARAFDHQPWSAEVAIKPERDAQTIDVPALAPIVHTRTIVTPPSRTAPIALTVSALALGAGAVGFELWGRRYYDDAKREPDDARQQALWHSANTRRYLAEGLGVAAIGCAGVAIFLFSRPGTTETIVMPTVTGSSAGVQLAMPW